MDYYTIKELSDLYSEREGLEVSASSLTTRTVPENMRPRSAHRLAFVEDDQGNRLSVKDGHSWHDLEIG